MALTKKDGCWYGENHEDLQKEMLRYSKLNEYTINHFKNVECSCGGVVFRFSLDEDEGAAIRACVSCGERHPMGDSSEFLDDAECEEAVCICDNSAFELSVGVALYEKTEDVRWIYFGCRCVKCGLSGVYGDWKNEFEGYRKLLSRM